MAPAKAPAIASAMAPAIAPATAAVTAAEGCSTASATAAAMGAATRGSGDGNRGQRSTFYVLVWHQTVSHPSREIVMDGVLIFFHITVLQGGQY